MKLQNLISSLLGFVATLSTLNGTVFGQTSRLDDGKFEELHKQLRPGDEPWLTIPWKTRLLDAQAAAARDGKPIFIWAMDGHPLGCT
ncbi:MAG TPA: hypothetical protein DDW52_03360 [Planctomycetaceae bacterium]|nr:hypothetical protein [Planctomycetaceae bacterium]